MVRELFLLKNYFHKMKGTSQSPPRVDATEIFWSLLGGCLGIAAVAFLQAQFFDETQSVLVIGSFGASAVLIYGAIKSPLAQPRNLIGGHLLSALIGVLSFKLLHSQIWLAAAVAVAVSIALMQATKTLHPPGGATALIAVVGGPKITGLGFFYCLCPVGAGVLIMLIVALVVNNIPRHRKYPEYWL
ncbi:MAG: HPP family protein [Thermodesulfobacteriota bacterium]